MTLRFDDGVEFDPTGKPRIERRFDGLYVVGNGMVDPVSDIIEATEVLNSELMVWKEEQEKKSRGGG
jgi:hypothetical protein